MVIWEDSFNIDVPEIDKERKVLVKIFNKILEALDCGKKDRVLNLIKGKLIPLIEKHRELEEKLMEKVGYPDLEKHKKEHDNLINKLHSLAELEDLDQLKKKISLFCLRIVRHLFKNDKEFGKFYREIFSNKRAFAENTIDLELEEVFEELLLLKSRDFTKYVKDEFHITEIIKKQVKLVKNYLYSSQDEEIKALKVYILSIFERHAKLSICLEDLLEFIEALSKKLLHLQKLGVLEGVSEAKVREFVSFLEEAACIKYLENNLEYLSRVSRFKFEEVGKDFNTIWQVIEDLCDFISGKLKTFDLNLYDFEGIQNYLHSLEFMVQSHIVKTYANLVIASYYNFLSILQELVSFIMDKSFKKAFFLSNSLIREIDILGTLLFYIKSSWQKSSQKAFFKFLADPINVDKVVGVIFLTGPSTTTSRNIFSDFSENLRSIILNFQKSNIFFFDFTDHKRDIYRGYIVYFPPEGEKIEEAKMFVSSIFDKAKEVTKKKFLIGSIVDSYIKLVFLDVEKLVEKFKFNADAVSLFIEELDYLCKVKRQDLVLTKDTYEELAILVKIDIEILRLFENIKKFRGGNTLDFLRLFGQPIFRMDENSILGLEILSRIKLNNRLVPAEKFIEIVQKEKLTTEFDLVVLRKLKLLLRQLSEPVNFKIFLNLFPSSYFDPSIHEFLGELKKLADEKTEGLVLEVTEQENFDFTQMVNYLAKYDVEIALDDFGSGYANIDKFLTLIKYEKMKYLKLDSMFSRNIKDPLTREILKGICDLMGKLEKYIIFEAIEDEETLDEIKKITKGVCDPVLVQGFYLSRPKPLVDFLNSSSN